MGDGPDTFYSDLQKKFSDISASGGSATTATAGKDASAERGNWEGNQRKSQHNAPVMRFGKALSLMTDTAERNLAKEAIEAFARAKTGSGDVTSLLTTSISERDAYIRNDETPFLNFLESFGPLTVNDWTYRIPERRAMGPAARINPESQALARNFKASSRTQRTNTLAFWGDPVRTSVVSREMVSQQGGPDIHQQDIDGEYVAIRQAKEYDYLNGIEQRSFAPYNVPVVGGLLSRIYTHNVNATSGTVTDSELAGLLTAIGTGIGQGQYKVAFTDVANIAAVRAIEIGRYNGNNPMAYKDYNASLAAQYSQYKIPIARLFDPAIGPPLPLVHTSYLPAGYMIVITVNPAYVPREARFKIGGEYGPHLFVKTGYELEFYDTAFVIDGGTLDDPGEETRGVLYNLI